MIRWYDSRSVVRVVAVDDDVSISALLVGWENESSFVVQSDVNE